MSSAGNLYKNVSNSSLPSLILLPSFILLIHKLYVSNTLLQLIIWANSYVRAVKKNKRFYFTFIYSFTNSVFPLCSIEFLIYITSFSLKNLFSHFLQTFLAGLQATNPPLLCFSWENHCISFAMKDNLTRYRTLDW